MQQFFDGIRERVDSMIHSMIAFAGFVGPWDIPLGYWIAGILAVGGVVLAEVGDYLRRRRQKCPLQ